jgi:chemotaxis regulatin CheY-phosphate phosphatase CheZ
MATTSPPQPQDPTAAKPAGETGLLSQFVHALSGLLPMLDHIKATIEESSGKIPKASSQLHSVTQATESATVEILNALDDMTQNVGTAERGLQRLAAIILETAGDVRDAIGLLQKNPSADPEHARGVETLVHMLSAGRSTEAQQIVETVTGVLATTRDSSMNIAMALQVQDITSQQIASVTHMIESVRLELTHMLGQFRGEATGGPAKQAEPTHFDTDAQYTPTAERQDQADMIIQQWTSESHG